MRLTTHPTTNQRTYSPHPKQKSNKKKATKQSKKKAETEGFDPHASGFQNQAPYRWPQRRIVIICHSRQTNFRRPPPAEWGVGARSFAGDTEGSCAGGEWNGRAAAGDRVALGSNRF